MELVTIQDLFRRPKHPYLQALMAGGSALRHGRVSGLPIREIKAELDGAMMISASPGRPTAPDAGKPMLEIRGLTKSYGTRKTGILSGKDAGRVLAVDDVSFHINRGECLGLVGESGCGKTTTSKVMMRALGPDSGEFCSLTVATRSMSLSLRARSCSYRRKVQFMFQDPSAH